MDNINNNHHLIPTKTYYDSPKNDKRKKRMNFRMENFQYKSFNKKHNKLKNYLKKTFKEKCETKRISNYNSMNMNSNNNLFVNKNNNYNNKKLNQLKTKHIFSHQKSNPLMKIKKTKYLSQSHVSTNLNNEDNLNIISKNNLDFNKSYLQSFIFTKNNNLEKDYLNNSFFLKRVKEKESEKKINKSKSLEIKEKKNNNINNDLYLRIKELKNENDILIKKIEEKEKLLLENKYNYTNEKHIFDKKIIEYNQQIINMTKEIKDLKNNNSLLNSKISNLNKEKNNLKNEINFKNTEYRELMSKKLEINNLLQKAKEKNDKNYNEIKKITKENNELKNRILNYIKTIDDYKQKNDNFQYRFDEYERKINSLSYDNNKILNELENKNINIIDLKNKINNIKSKNTITNKKEKNNEYKISSEIILQYINYKNYICQTETKNNKHNNALINPNNYYLIISYSLNNLKWYLFKKKIKINDNNDINKSLDNIFQNNDYSKYIWVSSDNIDNINEFKYSKDYKSIKNSSNKKDNEKNNNSSINTNNKQTKKLIKSNTENGLIGLSFINQDEKEVSNFLDDYCFEDILNDLGDNGFYKNAKNYNIYNIQNNNNKIYFNTPKKYYPNNINNYSKNSNGNIIYKKGNIKKYQKNINLKQTIDILLNQINPNSNFRNTFSSILKQLGCNDDDIFKLIENYNIDDKTSFKEK